MDNMDNIPKTAEQLGEAIARKVEPLEQKARETVAKVREESHNAVCCASDYVSKNPLSSLVGAVAFGVAIGCLIMSGRQAPTLQQRYVKEPLDQASDMLSKVSESLGSLASNLKFW